MMNRVGNTDMHFSSSTETVTATNHLRHVNLVMSKTFDQIREHSLGLCASGPRLNVNPVILHALPLRRPRISLTRLSIVVLLDEGR